MSIDILQEKIRKLKNPLVIDFGPGRIPPHISAETSTPADAYRRFYMELLDGLQHNVPAARFHIGHFAMLGPAGIGMMEDVLKYAASLEYYVFLDIPGCASPAEAELAAQAVLGGENAWPCSGIILQPFLGIDGIRPFLQPALSSGKTLFVLARTANRSAAELQDLLTGSRVMHQVIVENVKRLGARAIGRCCYNEIGAVISATAPSGTRTLRSAFPEVFFLLDGLDYVGGNAGNCRYAFDRVGHGAAVCAGSSVTEAWAGTEGDGSNYVECAIQSVDRIKRNISRYVTIL